jgi:hypothetical protein
MVGTMAGDIPITNRTLPFKNVKLGTHLRTCKARPSPPLSWSWKYYHWKKKCEQTCFPAVAQYIKYLVYLNVLCCDNMHN